MQSDMLTITRMAHIMTKVKMMKKSNYQKALECMEKETNRAVAQVDLLSKLFDKVTKKLDK